MIYDVELTGIIPIQNLNNIFIITSDIHTQTFILGLRKF